MNYLKQNPVGIDIVIDRIQKSIYKGLTKRWSYLDIFGRVYSNVKLDDKGNEEYVLEHYLRNGEYLPVLTSDSNKIFFIQGNNVEITIGRAVNDLWLVAIVDLKSMSSQKRADEEVHVDLITELSKVIPLSDISEIRYGLENLRQISNENFEDSNFRFSDIHPKHLFMVLIDAKYSLIQNNC